MMQRIQLVINCARNCYASCTYICEIRDYTCSVYEASINSKYFANGASKQLRICT